MNFAKRLERTRCGDCLVTEIVYGTLEHKTEAVIGLADEAVFSHVRRRRSRNTAMKVDDFVNILVGKVQVDAAEAGDAAHQRINHGLNETAGDSCVGCVAPALSISAPTSTASGWRLVIIALGIVVLRTL